VREERKKAREDYDFWEERNVLEEWFEEDGAAGSNFDRAYDFWEERNVLEGWFDEEEPTGSSSEKRYDFWEESNVLEQWFEEDELAGTNVEGPEEDWDGLWDDGIGPWLSSVGFRDDNSSPGHDGGNVYSSSSTDVADPGEGSSSANSSPVSATTDVWELPLEEETMLMQGRHGLKMTVLAHGGAWDSE
jgi:hypothetical protein